MKKLTNKTCIPKHLESDWKFYVHLQDKIGITTTKELLKVCNQCDDFFGCDYRYDLLQLLKENETQTR